MTPHLHPGPVREYPQRLSRRHLAEFWQALQDAEIPLEIGMAAEVRIAPEILTLLDQGEVPFLGEMDGYRILLLELPHTFVPPGSEKFVDLLLSQKIRPLIAHPERNADVIRDAAKIKPFIERGCLLQLTAASLVGVFGQGPLLRAREFLDYDVFKVLATDAHNLEARRPLLKEGMAAATEILGHEAAHDLVDKNPRTILGLPNIGITND